MLKELEVIRHLILLLGGPHVQRHDGIIAAKSDLPGIQADMPPPELHARIRFESFELDLRTRELRKNGRIIKLQDQPGKLLALLACRAGELVTREEIEKALWARRRVRGV